MSNMQVCRKCGQMISVIQWGVYRKTVVDAVPYYVVPDPLGQQFLRVDGSKVRAREVPFETEWSETAYKPHICGGRK